MTSTTGTTWTVGEVARRSGVTVRALHHWDEVGLLRPRARTPAGYRRYGEADLDRLQRVLLYRELGLPLEEIATLLDDPRADAQEHLRRQHGLLLARAERLTAMVAAVERALEAARMGISLTPEERFEVFGASDPERHAAEAEERWGDTDAYRESQRRTASYGKEQWLAVRREADEIERALADAMVAGTPAGSPGAMDLAERHRLHVDRWYYPCPHGMHRALGEMYVADERFAAHYERRAPGLAAYVRDAVLANADRAGA